MKAIHYRCLKTPEGRKAGRTMSEVYCWRYEIDFDIEPFEKNFHWHCNECEEKMKLNDSLRCLECQDKQIERLGEMFEYGNFEGINAQIFNQVADRELIKIQEMNKNTEVQKEKAKKKSEDAQKKIDDAKDKTKKANLKIKEANKLIEDNKKQLKRERDAFMKQVKPVIA